MSDTQITEELEAATPRMMDTSPEYREIFMLGRVLYASGYFKDIKDQAQAVVKILWGKELNFSPIVALSGIHIIEGKPALSSNLMATLIKRSGKYDYRVKTWTNQECVLTFREKVEGKWEEVGESSFTMEDAKAAGVIRAGGSWSKYPRAMMFARALSQGLRTYCPDVSAAPVYNPEEMGAEVTEEGDVTQLPKSARPVERTTADIPIAPLKPTVQEAAQAAEAATHFGAKLPPLPPLDELVESATACKECNGSGRKKYGTGTRACYHCEGSGKIGSPVKETAAAHSSAATSKGQPEPPKTPSTDDGQIASVGLGNGTGETGGRAGASPASSVPVEMADCISVGEAANFHRMFKDALPAKLRKQELEMSHDWLRSQGILDVLGQPSALAIKKASFYDVRNAAVEYAKAYQL